MLLSIQHWSRCPRPIKCIVSFEFIKLPFNCCSVPCPSHFCVAVMSFCSTVGFSQQKQTFGTGKLLSSWNSLCVCPCVCFWGPFWRINYSPHSPNDLYRATFQRENVKWMVENGGLGEGQTWSPLKKISHLVWKPSISHFLTPTTGFLCRNSAKHHQSFLIILLYLFPLWLLVYLRGLGPVPSSVGKGRVNTGQVTSSSQGW